VRFLEAYGKSLPDLSAAAQRAEATCSAKRHVALSPRSVKRLGRERKRFHSASSRGGVAVAEEVEVWSCMI
jgi:hypothetical protein